MTKRHDTPMLGDGVAVDVQKLIDQRLLVQANSGGGKSYLIRKLCEIAYGHAQIIVLDVEGEFYTLREHFDFLLAGKDGGDCPATITAAPLLARHLLELGTNAVIDIYELGAKRPQFISEFLGSIMEAPRHLWHDLIIVIDEANKFCPEDASEQASTRSPRGMVVQWDSTAAIIDLMTRGRKRGFCGVLATQRLAAVNKNAAAECNNYLIGRCNLDVDIDRAAKKLGMRKATAQQELPALRAGQFFAGGEAFEVEWSPGRIAQIQVGEVETTHPKRGQKPPVPPAPATVKKILAQLANIPEEAQQELKTKDDLLRANADLVKQIIELKKNGHVKTSEANAHFAAEWKAGWESEKKVNQRLSAENQTLRTARVHDQKAFKILSDWFEKTGREWRVTSDAIAKVGLPVTVVSTKDLTRGPSLSAKAPKSVEAFDAVGRHNDRHNDPAITGAHQRVLDIIELLNVLHIDPTRETIAMWYGQHPESRGFRNYLSSLRTGSYIDKDNRLTDLGKARANAAVIPTQEELRERVMAPLAGQERRVLQFVIDTGNATREEIAEYLGCHPETRSYRNIISKLRTRGLIEKGWPVKPAQALFLPVVR